MSISSISRSRATNLTGLIDIDALVEANTLRQKNKINTSTQNLKIQEYKQEQYRDIITKSKTFYNKYCDVLNASNFLSSSAYNTTSFTPSDPSVVKATGSSASSATNYKITVDTLATKASTTFDTNAITSGNEVTINGKKFILSGATNNEMARNLNSDLVNAGIKVNARYSDLANGGHGGLVIENSTEGATTLDVTMSETFKDSSNCTVTTDGSYSTSVAKANLIAGNKIDIGGQQFEMIGATEGDIVNDLDSQLASKGLTATYDSTAGKMIIKSKTPGEDVANKFEAKLIVNSSITTLKVDIDKGYTTSIDKTTLTASNGIGINGQNFRLDFNSGEIDFNKLNEQLKDVNIKAELDGNNIVLSSINTGVASKFDAKVVSYEASSNVGDPKAGTNLTATVTEGTNKYTITNGQGIDEKTISGNTVTLDGTTFTFTGTTAVDAPVTLTGKTDGTKLKDKIVDFIKDYNELLGSINTKLYEKYDRSYKPLTDDDKEGLSDSEIEKLEKKAQTGLLRNDEYLTSFADDMKLTMTTMIEKSGLSLESIGVKPVKDYSSANGLFTVNEDELLAAIEKNPAGISELFAGSDGIITKLKDNLSEHATGVFSKLANKAGIADGVSSNTNEMTKDIEQRKRALSEMQAALTEKENQLYSKYSRLESSLSDLQAQQSSLSSYFTS